MFERFDESALRALFYSRYEASRLSSSAIDSEHVLLGILRDAAPGTRDLLAHFHIDPAAIQARFASSDRVQLSQNEELPLTADAMGILLNAPSEAQLLGSQHVTPQVLLLAILRVTGSHAARVLHESGMTLESAANYLARQSPSRSNWAPPSS